MAISTPDDGAAFPWYPRPTYEIVGVSMIMTRDNYLYLFAGPPIAMRASQGQVTARAAIAGLDNGIQDDCELSEHLSAHGIDDFQHYHPIVSGAFDQLLFDGPGTTPMSRKQLLALSEAWLRWLSHQIWLEQQRK